MTKIINLSPSEIQLLKEELDIDDEMDEADEKPSEDDPYFLLAQRLANAPQVKVRQGLGVPISFGLKSQNFSKKFRQFEGRCFRM